jgi:hypothetical protein
VLQDRLVGLEVFLGAALGRSDEGVARQALVEGEAVALAHDLSLRRDGRDFAALPGVAELQRAIRTSATGPVLARAPAYFRTMLIFPYASGLGFVHAFRQRRPWAQLSAVYQDPPRSSAQILHPGRYFDRREDPVPLPLPDLFAVLPSGSKLALEEELGEIGIGEVLRRFLGDSADAVGWRGDRYALWDLPTGDPLLLALVVWDTDELATAFSRDYARVMSIKRGPPPTSEDPTLQTWPSGASIAVIERRHRTVLLIEGAPMPLADTLRAAVWAKPVLY